MFNFSFLVLIFVFSIPILVMALTLVSKQAHDRRMSLIGVGVVIAGLLVLALGGEVDIVTGLKFMGEPVTFSISYTAILLYFVTLLVLGGIVWQLPRDEGAAMMPYQWSLLNLSLSFGFIAFISGQFMIRYIALDIVGLLAALTVLNTFSATSGLKHFIIIFQILRLGDLSLLASILLINHISGTLDISQMIAAAVDLPPDARMWVFLGFLLALLIKLAVWPFGIWLERAHRTAPRISFWISGVLVPALGYYLLYRITPIITATTIFQNITLYSALILLLLIILLTALKEVKFDRFAQVGGAMSCFLLIATAFGGGQLLLYYLVGLVLHRWLMLLMDDSQWPPVKVLTSLLPLILNGLYLAVNIDLFPLPVSLSWVVVTALVVAWDFRLQHTSVLPEMLPGNEADDLFGDQPIGGFLVTAAQWLNEKLEFGVFTEGLVRLSDIFTHIAHWVYNNIERGMEKLWIGFGRKLVAISEGTLRKVEEGAAETTEDLVEEALKSLAAYEKNVLKKALRWDLAWIPFLLVIILIMLFVL